MTEKLIPLRNPDGSSYLYSGIQALSGCPLYKKDISILCSLYGSLSKLNTFNLLLSEMNSSKSLPSISSNLFFSEWNKTGEQDCFELLGYVMNQVYDEIRLEKEKNGNIKKGDIPEWLKTRLPLRMIMEYEIKCECDHKEKSPLQSDIALHLSFPNQDKYNRNIRSYNYGSSPSKAFNMHSTLHNHFQAEPIQDFQCGNTQCKRKKATRQLKLYWPPPSTICLHLQRLCWNGYNMEKIDDNVAFCNRITIKSDYFKRFHESEDKIRDTHYYLKSVIVKYGGESGDHYICLKKCDNKWYYTSDATIREESPTAVSRSNPYILFYEQSDGIESIPAIIRDNEQLSLFVHAMASCIPFVKCLTELSNSDIDNLSVRRWMYLFDLVNGNCMIEKENEEKLNLDKFVDKNITVVATKLLYDLYEQVMTDKLRVKDSLPIIFTVHYLDKCSCTDSRRYSWAYKITIKDKDNKDYYQIQDLLNLYLDDNISSQMSILDQSFPASVCIVLNECVQTTRSSWWSDKFKKNIRLDKKIRISNNLSTGQVVDKEYYVKSVIKEDSCIRIIDGCWYKVDKYGVEIFNMRDYRDGNKSIIVYDDNPPSNYGDQSDKDRSETNNNYRSIISNDKDLSTHIIEGLDARIHSIIHAISSCTNFITELKGIQTTPNIHLKNFMFLINSSNGIVVADEKVNEDIIGMWYGKEVGKLMTLIMNGVFAASGDKTDNIPSMTRQIMKCTCGQVTQLVSREWYINVNIYDGYTDLQKQFDCLFQNYSTLNEDACINKSCERKDSKKIHLKLDSILTKLICVKICNESRKEVKFLNTLKVKNEYWINSTSNDNETFHLRSVITISGCCYRIINNTWYRVTDKVTIVPVNQVINCEPLFLFYESKQCILSKEFLNCVIQCVLSCSISLSRIDDSIQGNKIINESYIKDRIESLHKVKRGENNRSGDCEDQNIFILLDGIFKVIFKEYSSRNIQMNMGMVDDVITTSGRFRCFNLEESHIFKSSTIQNVIDKYFQNKDKEDLFRECFPNILCFQIHSISSTHNSIYKVKLTESFMLTNNVQGRMYKLRAVISSVNVATNIYNYAYYNQSNDTWHRVSNNVTKIVPFDNVIQMDPYIIFYEIEQESSSPSMSPLSIGDKVGNSTQKSTIISSNVKLFNFLHCISGCSKFIEYFRSNVRTKSCPATWSSFVELMDGINQSFDRSTINFENDTWTKWSDEIFNKDIEPFIRILSQIFCDDDNKVIGHSFVILNEDSSLKQDSSLFINLSSISIMDTNTIQGLLDENFEFTFDKDLHNVIIYQKLKESNINQIINGVLPDTIGFNISRYLSIRTKIHLSTKIILRNVFCRSNKDNNFKSKSRESPSCINCCKTYRLRSMIDDYGKCYKFINDRWCQITENNAPLQINEDYLMTLLPLIVFYE